MGKGQLSFSMKLLIWLLLCLIVVAHDPGVELEMTMSSRGISIDAIYQFGDSVSDTGNWVRQDKTGLCATYPYGESYFHFATGRCSDGLIMVDFYAMAFGLELLNPYLWKGANFSSGVDFSVGGASALNVSVLESMNLEVTGTSSSLSVQFGWFRDYLKSICSSIDECKSKLETSLILMEAIGGVDYGYVIKRDYPDLRWAYKLVDNVVQVIMDVVKEMIQLGVVNVVVPTMLPCGCFPYALVMVDSPQPEMYDELGCLIDFNKLAEYHGRKLQKSVKDLQMRNPNVTLMYADYYTAYISLLRNVTSLGFNEETKLITCCGKGDNLYNFNVSTLCGEVAGVPVCKHPEKSVIWDGYHCTQHFYMYLSNWMLKNTIIPGLSKTLSF